MKSNAISRGRRTYGLLALGVVALGIGGGLFAGKLMGSEGDTEDPPVPVEAFLPPETDISRQNEASEDQATWLKHAASYQGTAGEARLAIVIVDDGRESKAAVEALRLSHPVTLALSPTADGAQMRAEAARRLNREVMLLLPMASNSRFDSSPNPVADHVSRDELLRRLSWNFAQLDGFVGVINQFGEAVTQDAKTMRAVMEVLSDKGLLFVDARTHSGSVAGSVARRLGIASGDSNMRVLPGTEARLVKAKLHAAATHAREWGNAIITIPADHVTVQALKSWLGEGRDADVAITPVTAVVGRLRSGAS